MSADNQLVAQGICTKYATIVEVRWIWIALPVSQVVLGCFFLFISICQSRNQRLFAWKDGSLATLFHGLGRTVEVEQRSSLLRESEMRRCAEKKVMQLSKDDGKLILGIISYYIP